MGNPKPWRELTVPPDDAGGRLDAWLAARVDGLSRREAQRLIGRGLVTLDGRVACKGAPLPAGALVRLFAAPRVGNWSPLPDDGVPLTVVHRDAQLLVVDKPSGVPSVPLSPAEAGTLAGAVASRFPECAAIGRAPGDGGLVQRLDRETSGLVLVARDQQAHDALVEAQRRGEIEKRYLALVRAADAADPPAEIDQPLGPVGPGARRVTPRDDGQPARTLVQPVSRHGGLLLVRATIHRGFRHQIRAHLAAAGHPIAGDSLYGGPSVPGLERLFLHAEQVDLTHPASGVRLDLRAPPPNDLVEPLARLPG